jgi:predicted ester cyclase
MPSEHSSDVKFEIGHVLFIDIVGYSKLLMNDLVKITTFAKRYAKAWCSQNPKSVAAFFAKRGSISINNGPAAVGRAAIAREAQAFMTIFPDMVVTFDKLESQANAIAFHWTLTGTNTGPGGTGKRVRISGYELWKIDNEGLIAESKGNFDSAEYERQLRG